MEFISVLGNLSLNTITINECKTPLPYRQLQLVHYFICHLPAAQYYLFIYSKDVYIQVLVHVHVYAYHYQ